MTPFPVFLSYVLGVVVAVAVSSLLFNRRMPWSGLLRRLYRSANPIQPALLDGPWVRSFYTAMMSSVALGAAVLEHIYGKNDPLEVGIAFAVIAPILAELKSWSRDLIDRNYWRRKAPDSTAAAPLNLNVYVIDAAVTMASLAAGVLAFTASLRVLLK